MEHDIRHSPNDVLQQILLEREQYDDIFIQRVLEELQRRSSEKQTQIFARSKGLAKIGRNRQVLNMLYVALPLTLVASLRVFGGRISTQEILILLSAWGIILAFAYWLVTTPAIRFFENEEGFLLSYYPFLSKKILWKDLKAVKETPEQIQLQLHSRKHIYVSNFSMDERKKKEFLDILKANLDT